MYTSRFSIVLYNTHLEQKCYLCVSEEKVNENILAKRNVSESSNASSALSSNFETIVPDFENTFAGLSLDNLLVWLLESSNLLRICTEIFLIPQGNVSSVSNETCG